MQTPTASHNRWQKSSFSANANNCLELQSAAEGHLLMRESEVPGVVLSSDAARLRALLGWTRRDGTF